MSTVLNEAIGDVIEAIAKADRTPGEQVRFEGIMSRLLESDNPVDRWVACGIMLELTDTAEVEYQAFLENADWNILVIGRVGETRAFQFLASNDIRRDFNWLVEQASDPAERSENPVAKLIWEHTDVWGHRLGDAMMPESVARRIAEMLNKTTDWSRK